jgi:hypothetical protein
MRTREEVIQHQNKICRPTAFKFQNCLIKSFIICFLQQIYKDHEIKKERRWPGHEHATDTSQMGTKLVGKPYGKRPLERPRHRREDDIKQSSHANQF